MAMSILDDLISPLKVEAPLREIRQGPFLTAVLTSGCGLAAGRLKIRSPWLVSMR